MEIYFGNLPKNNENIIIIMSRTRPSGDIPVQVGRKGRT